MLGLGWRWGVCGGRRKQILTDSYTDSWVGKVEQEPPCVVDFISAVSLIPPPLFLSLESLLVRLQVWVPVIAPWSPPTSSPAPFGSFSKLQPEGFCPPCPGTQSASWLVTQGPWSGSRPPPGSGHRPQKTAGASPSQRFCPRICCSLLWVSNFIIFIIIIFLTEH